MRTAVCESDDFAAAYAFPKCAPIGGNYLTRTRSLSTMASLLSEIASSFHIAVVVINQMTTKVGISGTTSNANPGIGEAFLVPALGESWAHATTTRLVLSSSSTNSNDPTCSCTLVKSPSRPSGVATYTVLECGIRDADKADDVQPSARRTRH
jgi:RAD51-like protein 2